MSTDEAKPSSATMQSINLVAAHQGFVCLAYGGGGWLVFAVAVQEDRYGQERSFWEFKNSEDMRAWLKRGHDHFD